MNDTAIVTCFYTNLHGTNYGGRQDRHYHYLRSLESLLKITNADFYIFCDPTQEPELKNVVDSVGRKNVTIYRFNLEDFYLKDVFAKYKNIEEAKTSYRCQEIQYLKSFWMNDLENYTNQKYEYIFWIDIGISYSGLIPDKHLIFPENGNIEYFNSGLFCNDLLNGLKKSSQNKLLLFAINNNHPTYYRRNIFDDEFETIPYHAIAGILGGQKSDVKWFQDEFTKTAIELAETKNQTYEEEIIYQIVQEKYPEMFNVQKFDMWWHEDNLHSIYQDRPEEIEKVKHLKSFYHTLEDLIAIGKEND